MHQNAGELPGAQRSPGVVHHRLHRDQPRGGIDLGVDAGDGALEVEMILAEAQAHRLAQLDLRQLLLRNGEIDPHLAEVLQGRDCRAGRQELAGIDLGNADGAGERRLDRLLLERRLDLRQGTLRLVELVLRRLQIGRGGDVAVEELPRPVQRILADGNARACRHQTGALDRIVELHQDLPLLHVGVGLEIDLPDDAAHLAGNVDAVDRRDRTHRVDAWRPLLGLHLDRRDGDGRHREMREILRDHPLLEDVEPDQRATYDDDDDKDDRADKKAFHGTSTKRPGGGRPPGILLNIKRYCTVRTVKSIPVPGACRKNAYAS